MEELFEAIASAFNQDAVEFTAALQADGKMLEGQALTDKVKEVIQQNILSVKNTTHSTVLRKSEEAQRKRMKALGFEIPVGADGKPLKGDDVWSAFLEWQGEQKAGSSDKQPTEMSPEELAKLPAVKALKTTWLQDAGKEAERIQGEFDTYKKNAEQAEVKQLVRQFGTAFLEAERAIFQPESSKTVTKEARLDDFFSTKIDYSKIGIVEKDGKKIPVPLDEDGEPLADSIGRLVSFANILKSKWEPLYGFAEQDHSKGSTSPGQRPAAPGQTQRTKYNFASESDFNTAMKNATDTTERGYMANDYAAQLDKSKT